MQSIIRLLVERPLCSLAIYAVVGAGLVLFQANRVASDIRYSTALEAAKSYSAAVSAIRSYYSSNVVPRAREAGATIIHDYHEHEGAIPLPATLTIELGEQISQRSDGAQFRLYSNYPYPWRSDGGPRDAFESEALTAVESDSAGEYVKVEAREGGAILRYAQAVRMGPTCIACHNSRADSPKNDWKLGDIRGVQSVKIPLLSLAAIAMAKNPSDFAFMIAGVLGGLLIFGFLLKKLQSMFKEERELLVAAEQRNHELAKAKAAAEAASHAKSKFLANMSHELRTPLNAILGFSEMIGGEGFGPIGNPKYKGYAQDINSSGRHLLEIINDILDLAKIESGSFELNPENVDIETLIGESLNIVREQAEAKNLGVDFKTSPATAQIRADKRALRQILLNLLSNAIKFTQPGGRILITAHVDAAGRTVFAVEDTGIGMEPEHIPIAMTPFEQIGSVLNRSCGGTGLGLPLVLSFTELHGGKLDIVSEPGIGTTVTILFPASRTFVPAQRIA